KTALSHGERKSLQTDRVILAPGPDEEIAVVREIFDRFTRHKETEAEIAASLNGRGILSDLQRPWTRATIRQILTNPKYTGANVYNRRSFKLKKKRVKNPREMWLWRNDAFIPTIELAQFNRAQEIITARHRHFTDDELLEQLRAVLTRTGTLSGILIDELDGMPSSSLYRSRFGSLLRAYKLIGFTPLRDYSYLEVNHALRLLSANDCGGTDSRLRAEGAAVPRDSDTDLLTMNAEFAVSLILAR